MKKKDKDEFIDDGHIVYNMDIDGMPHRFPKNKSDIILTKKETIIVSLILDHFFQYI